MSLINKLDLISKDRKLMKIDGMRIATISTLAMLMFPANALALDARDFADKLSATFANLGAFEITFGNAVAEGDTITLSGWDIAGLNNGRGQEILDGTVVFEGVEETAEGGYTATQAVFNDIDYSDEGARIELRNMVASGIKVFADPKADILNSMQLYSAINAGPFKLTIDGDEVVSVASISSTSIANDDNSEFTGGYLVTGIHGDLSKVDDSDIEEMMAVLDISEINASMSGAFSWRVGDGKMVIDDSTISIENIGQISMSVDLLGYTLELVQKLQNASKEIQNLDPSSNEAELKSMQLMMSMVAELSLNGMAIRFDDDSLTNKMLAFAAEEEGLSLKGMISEIASVIPEVFASLDIPELQEEVSAAIITFLKDPRNIEIKASPTEPVPFLALMAASQNPSIANDLLNISVTANQ